MSDIDILVHKEDLDKISEILLDLEYQKVGENSYHVEYLSKNNHCIEIHWKLEKDVLDKGEIYYGDEIWDNAIEINVGHVISKTLALEDQIIYLLFHMASHLVYSGFGLRQLCDFALLVKHKEKEVNWNKVKIDV